MAPSLLASSRVSTLLRTRDQIASMACSAATVGEKGSCCQFAIALPRRACPTPNAPLLTTRNPHSTPNIQHPKHPTSHTQTPQTPHSYTPHPTRKHPTESKHPTGHKDAMPHHWSFCRCHALCLFRPSAPSPSCHASPASIHGAQSGGISQDCASRLRKHGLGVRGEWFCITTAQARVGA